MNKDESLHRLLRRTSGARDDARPQGACLDAETLAAWVDGSLTAHDRAAAETHAADCDRCLAVLAAIAKTNPPPSAIERPSWLSIRWLVPLTTAALAITALLVIQGPWSDAPVPAPATPAVDAVKPAEPVVQPERSAKAGSSADALLDRGAPPPPESRSREQVQSRRKDESSAKNSAVAPSAAAAPAPAPLSRAEAKDERVQSKLGAVAQASGMIVSTDPNERWRVVGPSVERSTDGGRAWRAQSTGTTDDLLAGASPAPNVCWIVGRRGTVLLSTDGETWRRLDFPDATIDLVGVTAVDSTTATVTAANGRRYRTTDGGRTWTLQENPAAPF